MPIDSANWHIIVENVTDLVRRYGPTIIINYLLDQLKDDMNYKDECRLVNHLQEGNIEEAADIIEEHDQSGQMKMEIQQLVEELDEADIDQTELSKYK